MITNPRINAILDFWFGDTAGSAMPAIEQTRLWFDATPEMDALITEQFNQDLFAAVRGEYQDWLDTSRGRLAMIIILDRFSRHIYRNTPQAFSQDRAVLQYCLDGMALQHDHHLTLLERAFFYMPLEHSEDIAVQQRSVMAFQMLMRLSLPETHAIFENFLAYAVSHYETIKRFGRFPHRNAILGRTSTAAEIAFLSNTE